MPVVIFLVVPSSQQSQDPPAQKGPTITTKVRRTMSSRVHEAVKAIALCHNVTPVYESNGVTDQAEAEKQYEDSCRVYQASSPDEVNPGQVWPPWIQLSGQTGARAGGRAARQVPFECVQDLIFPRGGRGLEICPELGRSRRSYL